VAAATEQQRRDLVRLARGGTLNLVGAVISGVFGFVFAVVLTNGLGPSGAGTFFAVVALFNVLGAVTEIGAPSGLVRMISRYVALGRAADLRETIAVATWPVLVIGSLLGIALFVVAPWVAAHTVDTPQRAEATAYIRVFAPFLALGALNSIVVRAAQGLGSMLPSVVVQNISTPLLRTLFALVAVAFGLGPGFLAFGFNLPAIVGIVYAVPWVWRMLRRAEQLPVERPQPRTPLFALAGEFWQFTSYQAIATISQIVLLRLDVLLVSSIRTSAEAGIYAAASRYLTPGTMIATAIVFVVGPQLSGLLAQQSLERAKAVYQTATLWLIAISFPFYLALASFAPFLMLIFGHRFADGAGALLILSLAMLVNMGTGAVRSVLFMGGKSSWILFDNLAALATDVVLNVVLIPLIGINGAAIAWAASIAVGNLVPLYQVWRLWRLQPVGRGSLIVAACAVACFGVFGAAVRLTLGSGALGFGVFAVGGTAAYALLLWRYRRVLRVGVLREAFSVRRARRTADA
jgi:O-antigen/teichoic acid export membrane protein